MINAEPSPIRVLVVDDSAVTRTALTRMIESHDSLAVVGTAVDGVDGLEKISVLQPDVVTLDVEMPRLNGLETLRRIMSETPRPVIMVSSLTREGAETALEALDCGAFDYVSKQLSYASLDIIQVRDELVAKIKAAAESARKKPVRRIGSAHAKLGLPSARSIGQVAPAIVTIGTSTGGPKALQQVLPMLPADLPVGVVIVQHMPPGFTGPFAHRLNNLCKVTVREAQQNDVVEPGVVYIAPAGQQMTVYRPSALRTAIRLSHQPADALHVPSVDVLMLSVAEVLRSAAMGIILTGMGADGALGMKAILEAGGITVGQDEATCTVYGMPRTCAEWGILQRVVPLDRIPEQILLATRYRRRA
jgi:two-component system, chemotaxis family, protein-glutamate methylesterase/glutaminase